MASRFDMVAGIAVIVMLCSSPLFAGDAVPQVSTPTIFNFSDISCGLKVNERYKFYNIAGKSVDEWRKQMKQNGTKWNDGNVYSALTSWDIDYSYDISNDNGRYSIKSVKTKVDIVYRLPRLIAAGSDPELTTLWNEYLARLQQHEFGHKDLAVKTASEINEIFASLGTFTSKAELKREIDLRTEEKFKRLKEIQIAYDDETKHGVTQGAILPAGIGNALASADF